MQVLGLLGMNFDAVVVEVEKYLLFFRLALAILWCCRLMLFWRRRNVPKSVRFVDLSANVCAVQFTQLTCKQSKVRKRQIWKKGVSTSASRLPFDCSTMHTVAQCSAVQSEQNIAELQVRSVLTSFKGNVSVYRSNAPPNAVAGSAQIEDPILP